MVNRIFSKSQIRNCTPYMIPDLWQNIAYIWPNTRYPFGFDIRPDTACTHPVGPKRPDIQYIYHKYNIIQERKLVVQFIKGTTVCPKSVNQIYVVSYKIKWVTSSWTHSRVNRGFLSIACLNGHVRSVY